MFVKSSCSSAPLVSSIFNFTSISEGESSSISVTLRVILTDSELRLTLLSSGVIIIVFIGLITICGGELITSNGKK
ncbi:hypothetical protein ES706_02718 [subsurface metagenome]